MKIESINKIINDIELYSNFTSKKENREYAIKKIREIIDHTYYIYDIGFIDKNDRDYIHNYAIDTIVILTICM